jgi:hypothetical protein
VKPIWPSVAGGASNIEQGPSTDERPYDFKPITQGTLTPWAVTPFWLKEMSRTWTFGRFYRCVYSIHLKLTIPTLARKPGPTISHSDSCDVSTAPVMAQTTARKAISCRRVRVPDDQSRGGISIRSDPDPRRATAPIAFAA